MSESLVVVSKVKALIKSRGEMSTSASAIAVLTKLVEHECLKAVEKAKADGRKTVMDRDFPVPPSEGQPFPS
jgi:histone H3/H4